MQNISEPYRLSFEPVVESYASRLKRVTARVLRDSYEFQSMHLMERYVQDLYAVFMKKLTAVMYQSTPDKQELLDIESIFDEILRLKRYLMTNQLPPTTQTTTLDESSLRED